MRDYRRLLFETTVHHHHQKAVDFLEQHCLMEALKFQIAFLPTVCGIQIPFHHTTSHILKHHTCKSQNHRIFFFYSQKMHSNGYLFTSID